jgi:hypothetical protein
MRALLKGGNCHVFTDLGVGTDERDAESENPLSLTLPMPIPNCLSANSPANLLTFPSLLSPYLCRNTSNRSISLFPTTSQHSPTCTTCAEYPNNDGA